MRLNIIANCTDRKTLPPEVRLRSVPKRAEGAQRARSWWALLGSKHLRRTAAGSLYAGDHWFVVKSMLDLAGGKGIRARLWAISAGYGLIPADLEICSYSATFTPGHADSVGGDATAAAEWWSHVAGMRTPGHREPRSLSALVQQDPRGVFLIIASPNYLGAIADDLQTALPRLQASGRLVVVSSGTTPRGSIGEVFVGADGRLQGVLGGSRASLGARMARQLLGSADQHGFELAAINKWLRAFAAGVPEFRMPVRESSLDSEVLVFIDNALRRNPLASYTKLLRVYRDTGRACEMRRFKGLYSEVRKGTMSYV